MGVVIKESFWATVATYAGIAIGTVNALFLYINYLTPSDLGLVRLIPELATMLAILAQVGSPFVISRFYPMFRAKEKSINSLILFALLIGFSGFMIFGTLFLIFQKPLLSPYLNRSAQVLGYAWAVLPLAVGLSAMGFLESLLRANLQVSFANALREIFLKLINTLLILMYGFDWIDLPTFVGLFILGHFVAVGILYWRYQKFKEKRLIKRIPYSEIPYRGEMVNYGFWMILGGLGAMMVMKLDLIMLPAIAGLEAGGIYSIAVFFATFIEVPRKAINQISMTIFINADAEGDRKQISELYRKSALNSFLITLLLWVLIAVNLEYVFQMMPKGAIYSAGTLSILLLGLAKLCDSAGGTSYEMVSYSRHYKYGFLSMVMVGLLAVGSNWWLIPLLGMNGAALSTLMVTAFFMLSRVVYIYFQYRSHPFSWAMAKGVILAVICLALVHGVKIVIQVDIPFWLGIPACSAIIVSVFLPTLYFWKLSEELNALIIKGYQTLRKIA